MVGNKRRKVIFTYNYQASSPPHRLEMSMSVLPDGTCVYCHVVPPVPAAVTGGSGGVHPVSLSEFKKLGRPRKCELFKYAPVGVTACTTSPLPDGSVDGAGTVGIVSPVVAIAALGSKQDTFMPYIIDIKAGQDISSILGLFREKGHLCVLPANGVVSQAVLHQAESSVAVSYEGRFEILLLSGLLPRSKGACREIALSVMLAGINGKVFGGRLAGLLIAASRVQLVIGCFTSDWHEEPSIGAKRVKMTSPVNPSRNQLDVSRIPYKQKRE
ncbi:AT-hook motif nuclear-localized protein 10-like isoform X1 [Asparagus officinalis]|uniref:AT-hook motif nuclear-localized protein 10-like isoform X1 n=1 Tax=Asparagus officinalis TaxID=4686 RepID=UPI00098DED88|nr:AT-hook motif nuclear-localized protein 10-like isoform X1 [Asparagus officinalis]XP_020271135.1 AT-hook motif nuclear-localized protein 10-like isoform X1 [Asparagus officinalis]XP_020271140.1 AT-hook motif nuclear-localized protein 10-like isoform X1 [Asparagus officinalis]